MSSVQTAVGRFVWHDHQSADAQTAQQFYADLLGWETEVFKPGGMDYPMVKKGGQTHGGYGPAGPAGPAAWVGHVLVDDVDEAARRAQGAGGAVVVGPMDIPEVGRFAMIRDPQGAVISAFAASGRSPAPEGVFGWDELHTNDLEGAKRFYTEVFGWTTSETEMGEMGTYVLFRDGDTDRAGAMRQMPGDGSPPHWLVYMVTDNVDTTTARVRDLGGIVYVEPMPIPGIGRFSIAADSTGAAFGLFQPGE